MKKTSKIIMLPSKYDICEEMDGIAYIEFADGRNALLDRETKHILGTADKYSVDIDKFRHLIILEKTKDESKKTISIYDTVEKKYLVYNWELIEKYNKDLLLLKSPIDSKAHVFDRYYQSFLEESLDDAELLHQEDGQTYLALTMAGKQKLYYHSIFESSKYISKIGLVTNQEFDSIEKLENAFVYTKGEQKYFIFIDDPNRKKIEFDELILDKDCGFIFSKKGEYISVYDLKSKRRRFSTKADEIQTFMIRYNDSFLIKKDGKVGLCIAGFYRYQIIEPIYDKIENLSYDYYVLHKDGLCDIGLINEYTPFIPMVTNCEIIEKDTEIIVYKKDRKYGVFYYGLSLDTEQETIIPAIYDHASILTNNCVTLEQDGKKGLMIHGEVQIPIEYDEMTIVGDKGPNKDLKDAKTLYASLKKDDDYYLAKIKDWRNKEGKVTYGKEAYYSIEFLPDIMILRNTHAAFFNYKGNLLFTVYPPDTKVLTFEQDNQKTIYYYMGEYHYFDGRVLQEVYKENDKLFMVTYETPTNTYEITCSDKEEYDDFCEEVESLSDKKAERYLSKMSKKGVSDDYPSLTLKRGRNNNK